MDYDNLARALNLAAEQSRRRPSLDEVLEGIVRHATQALPSFDHVGLTTARRGEPVVTHAASTSLAHELDAVQYALDEGPNVDSIMGAVLVSAPEIRHEQRWPGYVPQAVEQGVRSQLALRLDLDGGGTVGSLSLCSTTSDEISSDDLVVAVGFAAHATMAFGQARQLDHLAEAIESRQSIGVAVGLIMERYGLDEEHAKAFLWRASSTTNVKVREVAARIVRDANGANGAT